MDILLCSCSASRQHFHRISWIPLNYINCLGRCVKSSGGGLFPAGCQCFFQGTFRQITCLVLAMRHLSWRSIMEQLYRLLPCVKKRYVKSVHHFWLICSAENLVSVYFQTLYGQSLFRDSISFSLLLKKATFLYSCICEPLFCWWEFLF